MRYNKKITYWRHKKVVQLYRLPISPVRAKKLARNREGEAMRRKKYSAMSSEEKEQSDEKRKAYFNKRVSYLIDLAISNKLNSFITLTFKDEIREYSKAKHEWELFLKRLKYRLKQNNRSIKYIAVHELQEKNREGVFHFHLLCDIGFFSIEELAEIWGKGFVFIEQIKSEEQIKYIFKYISKNIMEEKDRQERNSARKMYCSRNMIQPHITKELTEESIEDIIFDHMENIELSYEYIVRNDKGEQTNIVDVITVKK